MTKKLWMCYYRGSGGNAEITALVKAEDEDEVFTKLKRGDVEQHSVEWHSTWDDLWAVEELEHAEGRLMTERSLDLEDNASIDLDPRYVVQASFQELQLIVLEHQYRAFTWPGDDGEPLIVDAFTASAMILMHDALSEENRAMFEEWIARDRAHFATMVEFTWKHIK